MSRRDYDPGWHAKVVLCCILVSLVTVAIAVSWHHLWILVLVVGAMAAFSFVAYLLMRLAGRARDMPNPYCVMRRGQCESDDPRCPHNGME